MLAVLLGGCASLPFFGDDAEADEPRDAAAGRALRARGRRARSRCASCCSTTSTWRASRTRRQRGDHAGRARPARRRRAGAGARAARDRGLLQRRREGRRRQRRRRRPAAPRRSRSCPGRACACAASRSTRPRRWRRARRPARSRGPTGSTSCARPGRCSPGQPFRQPDVEQRQERDARRPARRRLSDAPTWQSTQRAHRCRPSRPAALVGHGRAAGRCFASAPIRDRGHRIATTRSRCAASPPSAAASEYSEKLLLDYQERLAQGRPVRRRVGRARRDRAARGGAGDRQGEGAVAAPGDVRHRLQRQHRPARLARALRPQGLRPAVDRAHHPDLRPRPEVARHRAHRPTRTRTCGATSSPPTSSSCAPPTRRATAGRARVGRSKDTDRFERLYYLEAAHAQGDRARR